MSLNIRALTIVGAIVFGGGCLLVGLANLIWESYGVALLELAASVYPGYDGPDGIWSVKRCAVRSSAGCTIGLLAVAWSTRRQRRRAERRNRRSAALTPNARQNPERRVTPGVFRNTYINHVVVRTLGTTDSP
jgi:hypothetical protein